MSHYLEALKQAEYAAEHRDNMDRQAKIDALIALGEWPCFSARNIAAILDMKWRDVLAYSTKTDRTGGRLTTAAIPHLISAIHEHSNGRSDSADIRSALEAGCSLTMAARLTGRSATTLRRQVLA